MNKQPNASYLLYMKYIWYHEIHFLLQNFQYEIYKSRDKADIVILEMETMKDINDAYEELCVG